MGNGTISFSCVGTVARDAELRGKGKTKVLGFTIAVDQGWGDRKSTEWIKVAAFVNSEDEKALARATKTLEHIKKGNVVSVPKVQSLTTEVYNDKGSLSCVVNMSDVVVVKYKNKPEAAPEAGDGNDVADDVPGVDDNGDIPF